MSKKGEIIHTPFSGSMDARSEEGTVPYGHFRLLVNVLGDRDNVLCRLPGWRRMGYGSECFLNQDLHDQMLGSGFYYGVSSETASGYTVSTGYSESEVTTVTEFPEEVGDTVKIGPFCGYAGDVTEYPWFFTPNQYVICDDLTGYPEISLADPAAAGVSSHYYTLHLRSNSASVAAGAITATVRVTSASLGTYDISINVPDPNGTIGAGGLAYPESVCVPDDGFIAILAHTGIVTLIGATAVDCSEGGVPSYDSVYSPCVDSGNALSHYYLCYTPVTDAYTLITTSNVVTYHYAAYGSYSYETYRGLYYIPSSCREHITSLFQFKATSGNRRLIAATKSRLYVNNDKAGNWRVLADALGGTCTDGCECSDIRFSISQLGNTAVMTNGFDPVMYWQYDDNAAGDYLWSADYIADLRLLGISSASIAVEFKGFMIVADVVVNGQSCPGRFYWSDFENPTSFLPFGESLAGYHDIGLGEKITNIMPLDGRLLVYTDRAIYEVDVVDDTSMVFRVEEIYRGPHVPRFRFGIATSGREHVFMSEDSLYVLYGNSRVPDSPEWLRAIADIIYKGVQSQWVSGLDTVDAFGPVNFDACLKASAGYDPVRQAFWFSWASEDSSCPDKTLILWPRRQRGTLVDHGFTAFTAYQPDMSPSIRDFMEEFGICDASELRDAKESVSCEEGIPETGYTSLINSTEDPYGDIEANSVLSALCDICIEEYCLKCDGRPSFIMADSSDKTLKQYDEEYYGRESMDSMVDASFPEVAVATYSENGYVTLLSTDPYDFRSKSDKIVKRCRVEFSAALQATPSEMQMDIATGEQPGCMTWTDGEPVTIECLDGGPADESARPGEGATFNFYEAGRWLGWRVHVNGLGGQFCMSDVAIQVMNKSTCW